MISASRRSTRNDGGFPDPRYPQYPSLKGAGGCICKDVNGQDFSVSSYRFHAQSAIQAEVRAILNALTWAKEHNLLHITVSSDCIQAVLQISEKSTVFHQTKELIAEIMDVDSFFRCIFICFIPRRFNREAHSIARAANLMSPIQSLPL